MDVNKEKGFGFGVHPWPLFIQIISNYSTGDAVGAYVLEKSTGSNWETSYHVKGKYDVALDAGDRAVWMNAGAPLELDHASKTGTVYDAQQQLLSKHGERTIALLNVDGRPLTMHSIRSGWVETACKDFTKMYIPPESLELPNPHAVKARELFKRNFTAALKNNKRNIFICFTNRCGSNYFADVLASGNSLNVAGEFFNADTMDELSKKFNIENIEHYIEFVSQQESKDGVLVTKLAISHVAMLFEMGTLEQFLNGASFFFIYRRDLLAQAISAQIAFQTGQWKHTETALVGDDALVFSQAAIAMTLDDIAFQNYLWTKFFSHNRLRCYRIVYEDFVEKPVVILNHAAAWLSLDLRLDLQNVTMRRQSREVNERWHRYYQQDV